MQPAVTVVLTKFKRLDTFAEQERACVNQTWPISEILVCDNTHYNLGPWARFATALMAKTEWIWILDDDILPGKNWLKLAMEANLGGQLALRGPSGTYLPLQHELPRINPQGDQNWVEIGAAKMHTDEEVTENTQVDFVIQGYLLKREWLLWFWEKEFTDKSERFYAEDQWLAYQCAKRGIPAIVQGWQTDIPGTRGTNTAFSNMGVTDQKGLWATGSLEYRNKYAKHWQSLIAKGWQPIKHG